ncbi:MAG TPA: riboflavin synthase [Chitinophagaceae bacterium]|nr:riboflavin synthase [Chitinophagaceae bacterium]
MFTGIIETTGVVRQVETSGTNRTFWIESPLSDQLRPDQSVSHNGVCLTVEEQAGGRHRVTAIAETLSKTNLGDWTTGTEVNLERCLQLGDRLDGHLVQGHVDTTARCTERLEKQGSWELEFEFPRGFSELIIEKGSICVNGMSLTAFGVRKKHFRVAIIPYTYEHTNLRQLREGELVNLEFDMIGKYVLRKLLLKGK